MDVIKSLFGTFTEKTSPTVEQKASMWAAISNTFEKKESFMDSFFHSVRKGAPLIASVAVVVFGASYYQAYIEPSRQRFGIVTESQGLGEVTITPTKQNSYVGVDDVVIKEPQKVQGSAGMQYDRDIYWIPPSVTPTPIDYDTKEKERIKDVSAYFIYYVGDVRSASYSVYDAITRSDGIIVSSLVDTKYANYVVYVPVSKFEQFRKDIGPLAVVVENETIDIKDRQDEKAVIVTAMSELDKLIAEVQSQLVKEKDAAKRKVLQQKIDSLVAQKEKQGKNLATLEKETSMAKVSVSLREDDESFGGKLKLSLRETFKKLGDLTVYALNGAIIGGVFALPFVTFGALVSFLVRRAKARRTIGK